MSVHFIPALKLPNFKLHRVETIGRGGILIQQGFIFVQYTFVFEDHMFHFGAVDVLSQSSERVALKQASPSSVLPSSSFRPPCFSTQADPQLMNARRRTPCLEIKFCISDNSVCCNQNLYFGPHLTN